MSVPVTVAMDIMVLMTVFLLAPGERFEKGSFSKASPNTDEITRRLQGYPFIKSLDCARQREVSTLIGIPAHTACTADERG
jgi:hypothetical protein